MPKQDYSNWSKDDLIKEIKKLNKRKKYGIVWEDKPELVAELCKEKLPVLSEDKSKEILINKEKPINILIEGDNYHALSVLNYTHNGKIDVIYIDPPYNTGNKDFMYNDRFVDIYDSYRHSKYLSFINKRLALAKNLMKGAGVIFISIGDNELSQLKLLCDERFLPQNFISLFIRKSGIAPRLDAKHISIEQDYILCYARNINKLILNKMDRRDDNSYKLEDEFVKERGKHKLNKLDRGSIRYSKSLDYPIKAPDTTNIYPGGKKGRAGWCWRWSKNKLDWGLKNKYIIFKKVGYKWSVYFKQYQFVDNKGNKIIRELPYKTILADFPNEEGNRELKEIFTNKKVFEYPKPTSLIKYLLKIASSRNSIILDFFAGTGTTAHAVLELNREDKGNRKFILCTNNENDICTEVCYPRIEKVIKGYKNLKNEKINGLYSNLKYFKTDFVGAESTDKNKKKIVDKSTEMLCLKEDCFDLIRTGNYFKVFKNYKDEHLGIVYEDDGVEGLKKEIKKINKKFNVYVFSLDNSARDEEFEDVEELVELKAIPASILNVYRRIFR